MRNEDLLFAIYLGVGVLTLVTCIVLRIRRKKETTLSAYLSNDIVIFLCIALWPIAVPILIFVVLSKGDKEIEEERQWKKFEDD